MRFLKYKCPNAPDDLGCRYPGWDDSTCENCDRTYDETRTVFDQIRELYYIIIPYEYRPKNVWYQFKCWAWHRYTTIKPRNLSHVWCDKVELIPNLVFEAATQYLEKEGPQTQERWEWERTHNRNYYDALLETRRICGWWLNEYNFDFENDKQLLEYAKRLIELSPYFWT